MKSKVRTIIKAIIPKKITSAVRHFLKGDPYKGTNVICTICHAKYARFAPYGASKRENARCLNCGSGERHRLLWQFMNDKTDFFSNRKKRLLHFAPEKCFFDKFDTLSHIEYFPCDLSPEIFPFDVKGKIQKADITSIPFPDNHFDVVLCNHVLEHIPDDRKAMLELFRVMKKGGWGIFQVPIDYRRVETYEDFSITSSEDRLAAFGQADHVRWYGRDYIKRLESVGLIVTEDSYVKSFSQAEISKFGFQESELIYYCRKA
jgi:SAM-dependent methyltransferase